MVLGNVKKYALEYIYIIIGAFLMAVSTALFLLPNQLSTGGISGISTILYYLCNYPVGLTMLLINVPLFVIAMVKVNKRLFFKSILGTVLLSVFIDLLGNLSPITNDRFLACIYGGIIMGIGTAIILKAGASTGGTDFVALYISNKKNKSIFSYVFIFNAILLMIFGMMFGWEDAGYSILFQFISTKTIDTFYNRYARVTLQITTAKPDEVISALVKNYRHGLSRVDGIGGYSSKKISLLHTVVSSYEVSDIVALMRSVDPHVIVNVMKTENFYGGFYLKPIE